MPERQQTRPEDAAQRTYEKPAIAWQEPVDLGPALALACGKFPGDQFCKFNGGFRQS
jgi:hypothetical protein